MNTVEITPTIRGLAGQLSAILLITEIRDIDGQPCKGTSQRYVGKGSEKQCRITAKAEADRAKQAYENAGYTVTLKKLVRA